MMTPDLTMPMEKRAEIARMNAERDQFSGVKPKQEPFRIAFGTGLPPHIRNGHAE